MQLPDIGVPWNLALLSLFLAIALPPLLMGLFSRKRALAGKHVLITGGSKGIGLALARRCVQRGASVTVLARSAADLKAALQLLTEEAARCGAAPKLQALSADTTDAAQLQRAVAEAEAGAGPVDVLICNAGLSLPGLFAEQSVADFERQVSVNYLGTVKTIKAALPGMLERRSGHVVIVTSALAVLGFAGYSSYAPTKWALRGLADCLRNELQGTGVRVSVGYPPDTDTPGYAAENVGKPALCMAANAALGSDLYSADRVAAALVGGIERGGAYHLPSPDLGANLLVGSMAGISPKPLPLLLAALVAPLVQPITSFLRWRVDAAVRKHRRGA